MKKKNGEQYEGEYLDGLAHGEGTAILLDQTKFTGKFEKGVPVLPFFSNKLV